MNRNRNLIVSALLGLGLVSPLMLMGEEEPPERPKTDPPKQEEEAKGRKAAEFAAKYGVPESEVRALRDKGLGWGEIGHALAISQKSGQPLSEVMKLRDSGMGWGKIARTYGFKLGEVAGRAKDIAREGRKSERPGRGGFGRGRGERGPRGGRGRS